MAEESMVKIAADVEHILNNNPEADGTYSALLYLAAAAEQLVKDLADVQLRLLELEARAESRRASSQNARPGDGVSELDLDQLQQDVAVLKNDLSIYRFTVPNYQAVKRLVKAASELIAMVCSSTSHDIKTMRVKDVAVDVGELRIVGTKGWCKVFEVDGEDRRHLVGFTLSWRTGSVFVLRTEERVARATKERA
jgi:hypothetical protein